VPVGDFANQLLPGESIVWRGAPRAGLRFRLLDIPLVLFGLFFTAISLVFVVGFFPFGLLIPHLWVGLYFTFGRFFVERKVRENTTYAITQTRALIVRKWPTRRSSTVNLATVAEISLAEHGDGTGTITFGGSHWALVQLQWGGHRNLPAFEFIDDAPRVMRLLHQPRERGVND
jgi:hypothetical protein